METVKEIEYAARRADMELAAKEVEQFYVEHMRYECVSRGYDFVNGPKAHDEYLKKAVEFEKKYGVNWRLFV